MRLTPTISLLIATLAMVLGACGDDNPAPKPGPNAMEFLGQTDYGCVASRGGTQSCLEGATLTRVEALGDTVSLWIRFEANCCPGFIEESSYDAGELNLRVVDTLYACRCLCPYENQFRFRREGSGQVRVIFESRAAHGGDDCVSGLDTTITVP